MKGSIRAWTSEGKLRDSQLGFEMALEQQPVTVLQVHLHKTQLANWRVTARTECAAPDGAHSMRGAWWRAQRAHRVTLRTACAACGGARSA